jgi:hypothetical protein
MKEIAIIEIYSHHVFVHTLASTLLVSGHKVTVYVSARIFRDLEPMFLPGDVKPNFCVSNDTESDFTFLKRIKTKVDQNYDLLFINSIQGYRIIYFYIFKFNVLTIGAAGRISEFFGSSYKFQGFETLRQCLHHNYTKFLLPKVLKRLAGLIVHTEKAKALAICGDYSRPIHCMPFSLYTKNFRAHGSSSRAISFMITGSITARSRDYFAVLDVFENIWRSGVENIELTVLSSPKTEYGFRVYKQMQRLSAEGYPINYFSGWIHEADFVSYSSKADFLIAPILQEYYGAGEITSVEVESVRMGIPAFYPDWYYVDDSRQGSSIAYTSYKHLQQMILAFSEDISEVKSAKFLALYNAETLSVDHVAKKLSKFLTDEFEIANTLKKEDLS